ncbi:response regulator [Flavobacteriaceae bacterium]|nr:response regulator [Flavobacteriaceae bacterium]
MISNIVTFFQFREIAIIFLVCFIIPEYTVGQEQFSDQSFVIIEEEITQYGITSIIKDEDGFLWIGSNGDGLFRYNSIEFKNYKKEYNLEDVSLNSSIVYSILQDQKKRIWVGTEQGINLYDVDEDKFEDIYHLEGEKKLKLAVHSIAEFNQKFLLLGTHGKGLYQFNHKNRKFNLVSNKSSFSNAGLLINGLSRSKKGKFFVGTNRGLMIFDPYNLELNMAKLDTGEGYESIDVSIQSMTVASDQSIWIGTFSSGVYRLNESDNGVFEIRKFNISDNRILSISEKSDGKILCGTENDGLFEIDYATGIIKNQRYDKLNNEGLKSNSIWSVFADEKDRVWLGYYNKGIDVYDKNHDKFRSFKQNPFQSSSLNSNSVTSIVSDKNNLLWIGLLEGGIDVYDPIKKKFTNLTDSKNPYATGLNAEDIQSVFADSKNNIWVGTWNNGLYLLENNRKSFKNINKNSKGSVFKSNRIMSFAEDSEGTLWIGTFLSGLYSYDPQRKSFTHHNNGPFSEFKIKSSNIRKIIVDREDNVWLGTRSGVYRLNKEEGKATYTITSLNDKMSRLLGNPTEPTIIFSLFEDRQNQIWIGSKGRGLFKYSKKEDDLIFYTAKDGLIHNTVFSITEDEAGSIWIGGDNGLSKLDVKQNIFNNFNKDDGLLSNNFNYNSVYKSPSNVLYFGNTKGINYFNPDKIIKNKETPTVYFTDLKLEGDLVKTSSPNSPLKKVFAQSKEITLNNDQSQFSIGFVGISYTRSESTNYAYYLEGFDEDWNYVQTDRSALYKNVPPGNYTFKVKAANNDGVWNNTSEQMKITILPSWWASGYALSMYALLTILFSSLIFKIIRERIQQKRILNFERENHKQLEALNAKKIQFFTNISHEFRTPLTLILAPLEDIIKNEVVKLPRELKEKHVTIYKNAQRLSRMINELMDFRKLQFNKISINASKILVVPFIEEVVSHFEDEATLKNINLSVDYEEKDISIWSDQSMLEKIIFNLLSNAFKATPSGGEISIIINQPINFISLPLVNKNEPVQAIEIIIKDNGMGIKDENIDKVFDRFFQSNEMIKKNQGGTGIGLELVKSFIDLNKGKIVLKSKEKLGSEFKIYLPTGSAHLAKQDVKTKKKFNPNPQNHVEVDELVSLAHDEESDNKKIILIVEDNLDLRKYIKNELKKEYEIKEAENGIEGLKKAFKYIPDAIISDVMMPKMDGFEFCNQIKKDIKTSHIPILMVTAKGMNVDRLKGIDSGADAYLNKPFSMDLLRSHLKQLIKSRQILFEKYFNGMVNNFSLKNSNSLDKEFINNIIKYINENINDESLNVASLAGELSLSRSKLYRKIKSLTGSTANEFIRKVRLKKAKQLLENSEFNVSEVTYKVGFSSPSYFTKCFKEYYGVLPTEYRGNNISNQTAPLN